MQSVGENVRIVYITMLSCLFLICYQARLTVLVLQQIEHSKENGLA